MAIYIEATPILDDQAICFGDLELHHGDCGRLKVSRNPATHEYILRGCPCKLEIQLPEWGKAKEEIIKCAIDEQLKTIQENHYTINTTDWTGPIEVEASNQEDAG